MNEKPIVRIKDIAKETGVSPATVSLVLNNKGSVGEDTRKRILIIAEEMGYKGPALRNRDEGISRTICFLHVTRHGHILNRDHDVFISDYIEGLSIETRKQNSMLQTVTFKSVPIEEVVAFITDSDADGFIILATELAGEDIEAFRDIHKPLIFLDAYFPYLNFNFVDMNNTDIIHNAVSHLVGKGHSEIGLINGLPLTPNFRLREEAFRKVMAIFGLKINEEWMIHIDSLFEEGYRDFKKQMPLLKKMPTAFLCSNDILAASSLKAVKESGLKVPMDLSLLGIDDLPLTRQTNPPLSSFQVSKVRLGSIAVQVLMDRLRNPEDAMPVKLQISGRLVERESVRRL